MPPENLFSHVPPYPGDPILSLAQDFLQDPRHHKVSLGIGLYFDGQGQLPVLECVRRAMQALDAQYNACGYLPMEGLPQYRQWTQKLAFAALDENLPFEGRTASVQTLGGSGALKVGADFIQHHFPGAQVWIGEPSWENHATIFSGSGFAVNPFPYYSASSPDNLRFADMLRAVQEIPRGHVLLLHAGCHNPTGVDLSRAQWQELAACIARRGLLVFFDMAYQGFGGDPQEDAWPVRLMAETLEDGALFLAQSFSKNFSLYGERVGALHVLGADKKSADHVLGQLKAAVRRIYSSPPLRGASIVQMVLADAALRALWLQELAAMRGRIVDMRRQLHALLAARGMQADYLLRQKGMFSYTGLGADQVRRLREKHAVYLVASGRMCLSGLTQENLPRVADALLGVAGK